MPKLWTHNICSKSSTAFYLFLLLLRKFDLSTSMSKKKSSESKSKLPTILTNTIF